MIPAGTEIVKIEIWPRPLVATVNAVDADGIRYYTDNPRLLPMGLLDGDPDAEILYGAYTRAVNPAPVIFKERVAGVLVEYAETQAAYDAAVAADPATTLRAPLAHFAAQNYFADRYSRENPPQQSDPGPVPLAGYVSLAIKGFFADIATARENLPAIGTTWTNDGGYSPALPQNADGTPKWVDIVAADPASPPAGHTLFIARANAFPDSDSYSAGVWSVEPFGTETDEQYTTAADPYADGVVWTETKPTNWTYVRYRNDAGAWREPYARARSAERTWRLLEESLPVYGSTSYDWGFSVARYKSDYELFMVEMAFLGSGGQYDVRGSATEFIHPRYFVPVRGFGNAANFANAVSQFWRFSARYSGTIARPLSAPFEAPDNDAQTLIVNPYSTPPGDQPDDPNRLDGLRIIGNGRAGMATRLRLWGF